MPPKKKVKKRSSFEEVEEDEEARVEISDALIDEAIQALKQQRSLERKQRRQSASAQVKCFVESSIQFPYILLILSTTSITSVY